MKKGLFLTSILFSFLFVFLLGLFLLFQKEMSFTQRVVVSPTQIAVRNIPTPTFAPLAIQNLRKRTYEGSNFHLEKTLSDGFNYHQSIVSYQSDGLKIYALLTIPIGEKPLHGFPAILFNHGYIAPATYQTAPVTGQYASYVASLANQGFIVLKPDYRGNGNSEGKPQQAYISPGYVVDDLNALSSLKKYPLVDGERVGIWGHSMGGFITLDDLVIIKNIKAVVIWSGVVGSFPEILNWWKERHLNSVNDLKTRGQLQQVLQKIGTPQQSPTYWNSIDPTNFLSSITSPIELHVGLSDETVPPNFSINLAKRLQQVGKSVEIFQYPGNDHDISQNFSEAMQRTILFFKANL